MAVAVGRQAEYEKQFSKGHQEPLPQVLQLSRVDHISEEDSSVLPNTSNNEEEDSIDTFSYFLDEDEDGNVCMESLIKNQKDFIKFANKTKKSSPDKCHLCMFCDGHNSKSTSCKSEETKMCPGCDYFRIDDLEVLDTFNSVYKDILLRKEEMGLKICRGCAMYGEET